MKTVDSKKIQSCAEKSDEPVHEYYTQFHIIFKENSGLSSDGDCT